jgi:hypothetical protein
MFGGEDDTLTAETKQVTTNVKSGGERSNQDGEVNLHAVMFGGEDDTLTSDPVIKSGHIPRESESKQVTTNDQSDGEQSKQSGEANLCADMSGGEDDTLTMESKQVTTMESKHVTTNVGEKSKQDGEVPNDSPIFNPADLVGCTFLMNPLSPGHHDYKGSTHNVMVEWENGEVTSEPLQIIPSDDPAISAKDNNLLDLAGWKCFKSIARHQKKFTHLVNQAKLRSFNTAP